MAINGPDCSLVTRLGHKVQSFARKFSRLKLQSHKLEL